MLPDLPPTTAGAAARSLVARFNAEQLTTPRWMRWRQLLGPVAVRGVESINPNAVRAWVQGTVSMAWIGIEVRVDSLGRSNEASAPVFWLGAGPPPSLAPRVVTSTVADLQQRLRRYMARMGGADLFSGVVIVDRNGTLLVDTAIGLADRAHGLRNTRTTRFATGSVGKIFTAVAAARLVNDGTLRWNDTIGALIPDYQIPEARSATVGQLLSHSAGLGRIAADWIAAREDRTLADLVRLTAAPIEFAPGSGARYSNEAFLVVGRIVEIGAGSPFEQFMQQRIFGPAGMQHTNWAAIDEPERNRATPYSNLRFTDSGQVYVPGPRRDVRYMHGLRGTPAGDAITTGPDMLRFARALLAYRLVDSATTHALFESRVRLPVGVSYSYGFSVDGPPHRVFKGGNAQGVSADLSLYLDNGTVVIVLSNYDQSAQVVAQGIRQILTGAR